IMNVRDPAALRRAAHLGIAMQLTNICRDVAEDERRGRVYLPDELLALDDGATVDAGADQRMATAVQELLARAEHFYRSGDLGLARLPLRCALAIRAARLIYADIGRQIARVGFDVRAGRAVVSRGRKLWLVLRAAASTLAGAWS
ncbi:MAG TPA: squalene/phytoene synthase family protein, partial [Polyangia bacterium]|nr:squalene/phytoene synthase family protein [Polyangia bacterium]